MAVQEEVQDGHLEYYKRHNISPVRYHAESIEQHFSRRDSLYRSIGLPPFSFRGARVLEIAPGSGQNSLYVASQLPETYVLVEPNPTGRRDIELTYRIHEAPHTKPEIRAERFQDFKSEQLFDIVFCENWLGSLPSELTLIEKLAAHVAPGGVLVLTVVPHSGFFANVMRRLIALRLVDPNDDFDRKTKTLRRAFGPHLQTLPGMTRSHEDWIHDCMLNPHYFNVALPLETALKAIGTEFEALATFPRFATDWRWFKGLVGKHRAFNEHLLAASRRNIHNFIDHRCVFPERNVSENHKLENGFRDLHRSARRWQEAFYQSDNDALSELNDHVAASLSLIAAELENVADNFNDPVREVLQLWTKKSLDVASVAQMKHFKALFGRETIYLSATRRL